MTQISPTRQGNHTPHKQLLVKAYVARLAKSTFRTSLYPLAGLVVFLAWIIRPVIRLRLGEISATRIGHQSANTELFLRRHVLRGSPKRDYSLLFSHPPANEQLAKMIRRRVRVIQHGRVLSLYQGLRSRTSKSALWADLPLEQNEWELFNDVPSQLYFTAEEESKGLALLASMGVKENDTFITFHVRDSAYLDTVHNYWGRDQWEAHDYRDANLMNFIPAVQYMAEQEITSIRLGQVVKQPLPELGPRIIDYATNYRTDFGDIYLFSRPKFFLTAGGGPISLAWIFGVPTAYPNLVPLATKSPGKNDIFTPKKLWDIQRKRFLTFRETVESGVDQFQESSLYRDAGLEVVDNTPEEILALTKEMNDRLDGVWVGADEDEELLQRFRTIYHPGHLSHGFPSRVGAEYLRQNRRLLE